MANKGYAYGLSRECNIKTMNKFDVDLAKEALCWIEGVVGEKLNPPSEEIKEQRDVRDSLKDGQMLCRVMNTLKPGAVKKIHTSKLAFKEMENIEMFLKACREYGMKEVDTFQTQDLYEVKAMYSVINCIRTLGSLAQKNGYEGPVIGVRIARENRRSFTEDQIAKGKTIIGLQYGSADGASQKGMTPYGATRKM